LNPYVKSPDLSQTQRQEIEEERAIALGINRYHLAFDVLDSLAVDILQVCGLSAKSCPIIDNLALDFIFAKINKRH
jgi:hypothetical protein